MPKIGCNILTLLVSALFVQSTNTDHLSRLKSWPVVEDSTYPSRLFLPNFLYGGAANISHVPLDLNRPITAPRRPGVTAVVLNWSRLDNVVLIASMLCGELLQDTVAEVFIWNNSPQELSYKTFASTGCPKAKLRLYNSSRNLYFYARFLACTQARTPFCFFQDDDYLVLPQIIRILGYRIDESPQTVFHLLPALEHLSSRLRTVTTPTGIHTGFAWLGYGTMVSQTKVLDFVSLLRFLGLPQDELQMADNYFTILGNQVPEIWFDHGIELGGGVPFTAGQEGHERNQRHIKKACTYLDRLVSIMQDNSQLMEVHPFVKATTNIAEWFINRTPCLASLCLLETNVHLLGDQHHRGQVAADLVTIEEEYSRVVDPSAVFNYSHYSLSRAVDGSPATEFRGLFPARRGEYIMLDVLSAIFPRDAEIELVFLIPRTSEQILRKSVFQASVDGEYWLLSPFPLTCRSTSLANLDDQPECLVECNVRMAGRNARFFKATLDYDVSVVWAISEDRKSVV